MRIGIDVGGTTIKAALCTQEGRILERASLDTPTGNAQAFLGAIQALCETLCQKASLQMQDIVSVGIGLPGSLDTAQGVLLFGTNLGLSDVRLRDAFADTYMGFVRIENDANCALLGEVAVGAARGMQHVVMLTLGTGLGGAIIINGALYAGCNGIAAEIGHMVIREGGWACNCGRSGCFEAYASATGLVRHAQHALKNATLPSVLQRDGLNGKVIFAAVDAGDAVAKTAFEAYVADLASGTANVVNIFQPDAIVFGGGIAGYGEKLLKPLREKVARLTFRAQQKNTQLLRAQLGNDAGLIGAALL